MTNLRIWRWGDHPVLSGWTPLIARVLTKGVRSVRSRDGDVATVPEVRVMQALEPRKAGSL